MKVLFLHANKIRFKPTKKALKDAEEVALKETEVKDCLVCLTSVEKLDESNPELAAKKLFENIKDVAKQVKAKTVVLYPYAHLSSQLASPQKALKVLQEARKLISKSFYLVSAPFGWYKEFSVDVKGHPLAELSREISLTAKAEAEYESGKPAAITQHAREMKLARLGKQAAIEKEKLSENDHRILGPKLGLFSFHEVAPGMVFFHPKGIIVRNLLLDFWREEHGKAGYQEISTPQLLHKNVWEISGHAEHYADFMFYTKIEDRDFAIKPMNCPGAIITFKSEMRSYKDLPLRLAEIGVVSRNELSGVLAGLFRMRVFTQDDAHIFVVPEQIENEIIKVIDIIDYFYKVFDFSYHVELSTRPKKFLGSKQIWDNSEIALKKALEKRKIKFKVNPGEGAFYGPKIDFHIKDSLGRTWQLATVQVDFQMPERFDVSYIDKAGKQQRPVIIHRVVYGSIERFMGILVEHYQGKFPLWLAPTQVRVISFTDRNVNYAKKIEDELRNAGLRIDSDHAAETVEYKVREAQVQRIPYVIVVGDKEEKGKTVAVRKWGKDEKAKFGVKLEAFVKQLREEIEKKR